MSFNTLSLLEPLTKAVLNKGYTAPTPIQAQTIPLILERKDIMGSAQTGTGKTAGFTLPLLQIVTQKAEGQSKRLIRGLIVVPTRELALQVEQSLKAYGKYLPLVSTVVCGGVRISSQIGKLRRGVDILIATPGRLVDLVNQKKADLSHVEIFVLDEADRLLDMGFIHDIRKIMSLLPENRQNLLFSATFSKGVNQLADQLLNSPVKVAVAAPNATSDQVEQLVYHVDRNRKEDLLCHLIHSENLEKVLVFTKTKRSADQLAHTLNQKEIEADTFHGDMPQRVRIKALGNFKKGRTKILVATDIASRGIDIDQLPHVINFELPHTAEDYIHRIGRTGRAGSQGRAISLVSADEYKMLEEIKKLIQCELPKIVAPGYEPKDKGKSPSPSRKRSFSQRKTGGPRQGPSKRGFASNRKRRRPS
jgi:ATP-dependent RNA helicase RhlE